MFGKPIASSAAFDAHAADTTIHFTEASIVHQNISGAGTNTHAQIDSHVADATLHFTEAAIDHTAIANIGSNSHAGIDTHISTGNIHYADAPSDASDYVRRDNAWVSASYSTFGEYVGVFDASAGVFPATTNQGDWFNCTIAGTVDGQVFIIGDILVAVIDSPSTTVFAGNWSVVPNISVTDHALLTNIGTNTHAQLDTHLADGTLHFTEASIAHANITGVGTNTHAQIDSHIADGTLHFTESSISHANISGVGTNTHAQIDAHIADGTTHFTAGSLNLPTTYLQLDAANGPLTGTLVTQKIEPDGNEAYNIGSKTNRYGNVWGAALRFFQGNGTLFNPSLVNLTDKSAFAVVAQNDGTGTAQVDLNNADTLFGITSAFGAAYVDAGTSGIATLRSSNLGTFVSGQAVCAFDGSGNATVEAVGRGAFAAGCAFMFFATGHAKVSAAGAGAFATGYIQPVFNGSDCFIEANGFGSFSGGYINANGVGTSKISALGNGSFAHGAIVNGSSIVASGIGSFVSGNCSINQFMIASGSGSVIFGAATSNGIFASGAGSVAIGLSTAGVIVASADNNFQLGPGTNAVALSFQVSSTMSMDATNGYFRAAVDGSGILLGAGADASIYYDGTNLIIDPNIVGTGRLLIGTTGQDSALLNDIEIDGALNHDGSTIGFHGATPLAQDAGWTAVSNLTTVKTFDANATTVSELADVLGTLLAMLTARGDIAI